MMLNESFANDEQTRAYLFLNGTGRRKRIQKGVDETHPTLDTILQD